MPRLIVVIESDECHGRGIPEEPYRTVTRYHDTSGNLLAEKDPWLEKRYREVVAGRYAVKEAATREG